MTFKNSHTVIKHNLNYSKRKLDSIIKGILKISLLWKTHTDDTKKTNMINWKKKWRFGWNNFPFQRTENLRFQPLVFCFFFFRVCVQQLCLLKLGKEQPPGAISFVSKLFVFLWKNMEKLHFSKGISYINIYYINLKFWKKNNNAWSCFCMTLYLWYEAGMDIKIDITALLGHLNTLGTLEP